MNQHAARFILEAAHELFGIQTKEVAIGAQETCDIGGAGQIVKASIFQRLQVDGTNTQGAGDITQFQTALKPGLTQIVSDAALIAVGVYVTKRRDVGVVLGTGVGHNVSVSPAAGQIDGR